MQGLYHKELHGWAESLHILFFAQQEAGVGPLRLVSYGKICDAGTAPGRHCSDRAVAEILNCHLHHKGDCCNNPGRCYIKVDHFLGRGIKIFSNFTDGIHVIFFFKWHMVIETTCQVKCNAQITWRFFTWRCHKIFFVVYSDMLVLTDVIMSGYHNKFLSSFNFKRWLVIHISISLKHAPRRDISASFEKKQK